MTNVLGVNCMLIFVDKANTSAALLVLGSCKVSLTLLLPAPSVCSWHP